MDHLASLNLTPVDYFVLVILLISALIGISRGLFKEVLALASWFIAAWVAYRYSDYLANEWLSTFQLEEMLRLGVSFLVLFVLTLIVCGLLGGLVQKLLLSAGLSLTDRFLGLIFGLIRGSLIVVIFATLAALTPLPQSIAWQKAITRPAIELATNLIRGWLPVEWAKLLGQVKSSVSLPLI